MNKRISIVIFSTPTCAWCKKLKQYIREKGFTYKDIDVSKNQRALRDMVSKSGKTGVPQIWINNRVVVGFDKNKINKLLNI